MYVYRRGRRGERRRTGIPLTALGSAFAWGEGLRSVVVGGRCFVWLFTRWSAVPQRASEVRNYFGTFEEVNRHRLEVIDYMLRRSDMPKPPGLDPIKPEADGFALNYPMVWSYMTQTTWEDGSPRKTSSLLAFLQDGVMKMMLRDQEAGLCLWVAAPGIQQGFEVMEAAIGDPRTEWRLDRKEGVPTARRVRKG